MLGKLKELIRRSPIKSIPIVVFVVLLTAALNIYIAKMDSDQLTVYKDKIVEQQTEEEWNEIANLINASFVAAKQNSKFLAQKIEVDLVRQYDNLDILQDEFKQKNFSPEFYNVLENNLLNENAAPSSLYSMSYRSVVGLQDGVIATFSNQAPKVENKTQEPMVTWETFIENNPNKELAREAVQSVLHRNADLIFVQTRKTEEGELEKNHNMTMNALKKAYMSYGIEGLKYYNILSPSYITDNGDIFNTSDSHYMTANKNYKLIILQSFNIADILSKYERSIFEQQKNSAEDVTFITDFVKYKHIKAITWSFILFLLSVLLVNIYNSGPRRDRDNEQYSVEGDSKQNTE